ncbi:MAG: Rrf2 family transcriptional regulator [Planctomycetes bacterium HGW-Planctomycetes-1]|nr:MAG: Rrf2 family transcriptional regulator [Planctomycetes bacterium HGW-Planctomycetes-1]
METVFITPKIVSQKCRYALRAIFELASRHTAEAVKISDIASSQAISPRFLENILVELKQAGFVASKRGNDGGYILTWPADKLTVGQVIAFIQGTVKYNVVPYGIDSAKNGDYAFSHLWQRLNDSISGIYNNTTFADLVQEEAMAAKDYVPNYVI